MLIILIIDKRYEHDETKIQDKQNGKHCPFIHFKWIKKNDKS